MFEALINAWAAIIDPLNLLLLTGGVLIGLVLGVVPGLGGITGLTILIPFVYEMSPTASLAISVSVFIKSMCGKGPWLMRAMPAPAHCWRLGAPGKCMALTGSGTALQIRSTKARSPRPGMKNPLAPASA